MADQDVPEAEKIPDAAHQAYADIAQHEDFHELRRRYRSFAFPATIAFMVWYILYVICNNWARDFMDIRVFGHVNIALVFGLLQFVSTFGIAFFYARHSRKSRDPLADELNARFQEATKK